MPGVPPPVQPVAAAGDAVLLINPRSGGGKAERTGLAQECSARGIEPILLGPGEDPVAIAEAAVARGVEVLGMAGGDGSLGPGAGVAARHGVAMVVVPTGTRNHLAMDLGLHRGDVVGALDAFGPAVERRVDLAEVNGRRSSTTCRSGCTRRSSVRRSTARPRSRRRWACCPGCSGRPAGPSTCVSPARR